MHGETLRTKDELGSFVGVLEEHSDTIAEDPEELVARLPAQNQYAEYELETETPQHWSPPYLQIDNKRSYVSNRNSNWLRMALLF